ncbi:UDP-glycosyltransferase 76C3-like [Panicum virgatum]|uniref:UDP-glycosyltransferase 76C3-like n=1 Tax=Panicum virgatum TaxID=38727 RepID=UPI0019D5CEEB|nr:UDP-glycosyltransferase 76C3-like [Panicum virgatum]
MAGGREPRRRRALVFPLPFQGHIDPMMHLAGAPHARGLAVTVLHTRFNALHPTRHPEFCFVEVPDGMPADVAAAGRIIDVILAMNTAMEASPAPVRAALVSAMLAGGDEEAGAAACLFIDGNVLAVQRVARSVKIKFKILI